MDRRLLVLALGMFAVGTDSFVIAGCWVKLRHLHAKASSNEIALAAVDLAPIRLLHEAEEAELRWDVEGAALGNWAPG